MPGFKDKAHDFRYEGFDLTMTVMRFNLETGKILDRLVEVDERDSSQAVALAKMILERVAEFDDVLQTYISENDESPN